MKNKFFETITSLVFITAIAHAQVFESTDTTKAVKALGASASEEIVFDEGQTSLKADEAEALGSTIRKAQQDGKINEVVVVAWADREYPLAGTKASNQDVELAKKRGEQVKKYLRDDLKVGKVTVYNMAKRPNALQELFNTSTNKVKSTLQNTGAAPTTKAQAGPFGINGKASEALVLIYR